MSRGNDPLVARYCAYCHDAGKPTVLLFPWRRRFAAIIYQSPFAGDGLSDQAMICIRRLATALQERKSDRTLLITPHGGEITGLRAERAEELVFRVADALLDARWPEN
ncbi:MAG: hypothetical protein K2W96_23545 [Gemmataceae bacterium]|nr:hypothetical protein [Gemmataceae bacterium]